MVYGRRRGTAIVDTPNGILVVSLAAVAAWLPGPGPLAPGRARVTARLPVTDLEELFGVSIEAEDVETVGGLLAYALGRVPIAGSVATVAGLTLTAESLEGRRNRIGTVTVERNRPGAKPGPDAPSQNGRLPDPGRFSPGLVPYSAGQNQAPE